MRNQLHHKGPVWVYSLPCEQVGILQNPEILVAGVGATWVSDPDVAEGRVLIHMQTQDGELAVYLAPKGDGPGYVQLNATYDAASMAVAKRIHERFVELGFQFRGGTPFPKQSV